MKNNSMLLYGRNSVFERLKAAPASINSIYLQEGILLPRIERLAQSSRVPLERLSSRALARIKPAKDLQGVVARISNFTYASLGDVLEAAEQERLSLLFLDRINDPQNLGVIIRTAACFGGFAVVIPKFNACQVNETVLHVASGGENHVAIVLVSNLSNAILAAKKQGYWIMGAMVDDDAPDIGGISLPFPLGLVLGSEGAGVRCGIEKNLDLKARIPMQEPRLSFNVAMASAIFCHEIVKQRRGGA